MPWSLVGNSRAVQVLQRSLESGGARHAYLFAGPEQTGRATAAKLLAQALNCLGEDRPCGECTQCRRIAEGIHSDVQTVSVGINEDGAVRRDISVEQMRDVERAIALAPYEGQVRVVIIDPAEKMNDAAQNAFLKSLEEPPPHVVFILITADASGLLETVRSRCATVPFTLVPTSEMEQALRERGVEGEQALLAGLAGGRPGWAFAAAGEKRFLESRRELLDQARALPGMDLADRFDLSYSLAEAFKKDREKALASIDEWTRWWRDVLVVQSGVEESVSNRDRLTQLQEDAPAFERDEVVNFVESLVETRLCLVANVQARIALDALMLGVPKRKR